MGYLELGYLEHPAISSCFSRPLAQINPGYLQLYYVSNRNTGQHQSGSAVRKCSLDKMYWKLRNVLTCSPQRKQSQTDWTYHCECRRIEVAGILLILGIKLLLQKFDANLAISNYFSIPLRVRDIAGFYCTVDEKRKGLRAVYLWHDWLFIRRLIAKVPRAAPTDWYYGGTVKFEFGLVSNICLFHTALLATVMSSEICQSICSPHTIPLSPLHQPLDPTFVPLGGFV